METEKVYFQHLNKLKDEDTRTLNETAVLQKQQNDINEDINRISEECRKVKQLLFFFFIYQKYLLNFSIKLNYQNMKILD